MTEIDRREVITGLAAVAVAGVTPALAESTPPPAFIRTRFHSVWRPDRHPVVWSASYRVVMDMRWHVDIRGDHDATFQESRGVVFAVYPERPGVIWLMRPADQEIFPIYHGGGLSVVVTGLAAALHHSRAPACLPDGRRGSFFIENEGSEYYAPLVTAAPPLPRIESFADGLPHVSA